MKKWIAGLTNSPLRTSLGPIEKSLRPIYSPGSLSLTEELSLNHIISQFYYTREKHDVEDLASLLYTVAITESFPLMVLSLKHAAEEL